MASRHLAAVQYHRHLIAHMDVGRAGHDLDLLRSDIHLADDQLVRVRVLFNGKDLSYNDLLQIFIKLFIALYLGSG